MVETYNIDMLIYVNPLKALSNMYTTDVVDTYKERHLQDCSQHIFVKGEKAYT